MFKVFLTTFISKKIVLVMVASSIFLGAVIYLTSKKLDEQGICWTKGKVLNDDELYQNAMRAFVKNLFEVNDAYRVRTGALGFKRRAADFYYCDKRDCDVWIAPPTTYEDILELKSKFREDNVYHTVAPDANSGHNEIPKTLGWQVMSTISEAGSFKQEHNSNTIVTTDAYGTSRGSAIFYPVDCCEIYSVTDWNKLVQEYPNAYTSHGRLPYPDMRKYLVVKKMFAPEINLGYNGRYGRDISHTRPQVHLYAINACGSIQGHKAMLELYPNVKE